VRLDAFLTDLARYAGQPAGQPAATAYYTCLAMDSSARSARGELVTALAVQWLTVQVSGSTASAPAVIIAGAGEVARPHLESLADACERRRVPLTLMFRHLRGDIPDQQGRRWNGGDGETPLPPQPDSLTDLPPILPWWRPQRRRAQENSRPADVTENRYRDLIP